MSVTRNVITGLAGVGIVSAGVLSLDNTERNSAGEIVEAGQLGVFSVQVGDCLRDLSFTNDEVSEGLGVPCAEAHIYEVFYETFLEGSSLSEIGRRAEEICLANFQSYVGTPYNDSRFYSSALVPTAESYDEGDREVTCFLFNENETNEYGSARNSGE